MRAGEHANDGAVGGRGNVQRARVNADKEFAARNQLFEFMNAHLSQQVDQTRAVIESKFPLRAHLNHFASCLLQQHIGDVSPRLVRQVAAWPRVLSHVNDHVIRLNFCLRKPVGLELVLRSAEQLNAFVLQLLGGAKGIQGVRIGDVKQGLLLLGQIQVDGLVEREIYFLVGLRRVGFVHVRVV